VTTTRAVRSLIRVGRLTPWMYRASTLLSLLVLAIEVALYAVVWRAIYSGRGGSVAGADVDTAVGYAVLGITIASVLNVWPGSSIQGRVRDGLIGVDLIRPIGLLTQSLAVQTGYVIAGLPTVVVGLATGFIVRGLAGPADVAAAVGFVVSLVLAFCVTQLITLLMSLASFWTLEVGGVGMIFGVVRNFMSGAILPLWFMPGWLRGIAAVLPFQAGTYTPLAIYFGRPPGGLAVALGVQGVWVLALAGLCALVWSRAKRRVVVQGG
jgi:ABC-2 type transport system permease protein